MKKIKLLLALLFLSITFLSGPKPVHAIYEQYFKIADQNRLEKMEIDHVYTQKFYPNSKFGTIEVTFHFTDLNLVGHMRFILKEDGNIVYDNIYPLDKFNNDWPFPFGFPVLNVKPGAQYSYEIILKN